MRSEKSLLPAGAGAFVMGTGIVSVGLAIDGAETVSRVLLAVAALGGSSPRARRFTGRSPGEGRRSR